MSESVHLRLAVDGEPVPGAAAGLHECVGCIECVGCEQGVISPFDPAQMQVEAARPRQIVVSKRFDSTSMRLLVKGCTGGHVEGQLMYHRTPHGVFLPPYLTVEFSGYLTGVELISDPVALDTGDPGSGPILEKITITCEQVVWRDSIGSPQAHAEWV